MQAYTYKQKGDRCCGQQATEVEHANCGLKDDTAKR